MRLPFSVSFWHILHVVTPSLRYALPCKAGDDLTQMWTFGAELRHLRRAAETYQAHPEGVPPLVLAEHIAFVITKDMTGLLRLGVTSHAPTVLLHEILLARGIQSKLVKGYTVMRGIKKGATTSCCPNIWVEACGQEFDMLARVADDLGQFFNSKLPAGAPPGGMSTLRVKERPLDVPLATELDPNPALKEESRELEHLWIAMERAQGEEHRILTYWFYSGGWSTACCEAALGCGRCFVVQITGPSCSGMP